MTQRFSRWSTPGFVFVLFAVLTGGCASTKPSSVHSTTPAVAVAAKRDLPTLPTFHGDGAPATFADVAAAAAAADVVILGENHSHPVGLPWAAMLFDEVLARAPQAALSLEFFSRDDQSRVDDYLKGITDDAAFRKRTARTASDYPDGHRKMVEAAKAKGRPVIASNATWEAVRFLRGKDYSALRTLTPEQQRLFRIPDSLPEGRYRTDFDAIMAESVTMEFSRKTPPVQPTPEQTRASLDSRFRAQSLWDWTMAESITRAADGGSHPVFQVIGRFHSDFNGGTPQAVAKIRPGTRIVRISVVDEDSDHLRDEDKDRADFVVYVGPAPEDNPKK